MEIEKIKSEHPFTWILLKEHYKRQNLTDTELAIWCIQFYEYKVKEYGIGLINSDYELFNSFTSEQRETMKCMINGGE